MMSKYSDQIIPLLYDNSLPNYDPTKHMTNDDFYAEMLAAKRRMEEHSTEAYRKINEQTESNQKAIDKFHLVVSKFEEQINKPVSWYTRVFDLLTSFAIGHAIYSVFL